jgi:hypothetical protein
VLTDTTGPRAGRLRPKLPKEKTNTITHFFCDLLTTTGVVLSQAHPYRLSSIQSLKKSLAVMTPNTEALNHSTLVLPHQSTHFWRCSRRLPTKNLLILSALRLFSDSVSRDVNCTRGPEINGDISTNAHRAHKGSETDNGCIM